MRKQLVGLGAICLYLAASQARSQVLDSRQEGPSKRVELVRSNDKLIRVEETTVAGTKIKTMMSANHVLVRLKPGKTQADLNAVAARLDGRIAKKVGRRASFLVELKRSSLDAVPDAVTAFGKEAAVSSVAPDYLRQLDATIPNDSRFVEQWNMNNTGQTGGLPGADIDAPEAWELATGSHDVVVGVIDTGMDFRHPEIAENIWLNQAELKISAESYPLGLDANSDGTVSVPEILAYIADYDQSGTVTLHDLVSNNSGTNPFINDIDEDGNGDYPDDLLGWNFMTDNNDPLDDTLHGTHVAGIIGARSNNTDGVAGVNWSVSMVAIKACGPYGCPDSALTAAIEYSTFLGVDLTNNSWGGYGDNPSIEAAVQEANEQGVLFVASAGNAGVNTDVWHHIPSGYEFGNVISVAATDHADALAQWGNWYACCYESDPAGSNFGPATVDLAAPGKDILSTFPTAYVDGMDECCEDPQADPRAACCVDRHYEVISGTSMAAPHVSGACALLKSLDPSLSYLDIKAAVLISVDPVPALNGLVLTGGRLNLFNVLNTVYEPDDDGDAIPDVIDNCHWIPNSDQADADQDGAGDVCDNCSTPNPDQRDADGDGAGDLCDKCPLVPHQDDEQDQDLDTVPDACDNCPIPNPDQEDPDGDHIGSLCDICPNNPDPNQADSEGDGHGDACDVCPNAPDPEQIDTDSDGQGDACDLCPRIPNQPSQGDSEGDGVGDLCDNCQYGVNPANRAPTDCNNDEDTTDPGEDTGEQCDRDDDGSGDVCDNCPDTSNSDQSNQDWDQWGDACDGCPTDQQPPFLDAACTVSGNRDLDEDGIADYCDPCTDTDGDGFGDWGGRYGTVDDWPNTGCDPDNCPGASNPLQTDTDHDGLGDACDACPGCGSWADADHDGDVDHVDFGLLQACVTGDDFYIQPYYDSSDGLQAGRFAWGQCERLNFNGGWHIDQSEIALFELCLSGPGVPADPRCGDCYPSGGNGIPDVTEGSDLDNDGVPVNELPPCTSGQTTGCSDNCPCLSNADQADNNGRHDGDGVGDACEPPPPAPPPDFEVTACRSIRWHGASGYLSIGLSPTAEAANATIEPRLGLEQIVEIDLGQPADPVESNPWLVQVHDGNGADVFPVIAEFGNGGTDTRKVVIRFLNDPEFPECSLLDQNCYTINLWDAIRDGNGDPLEGDSDCAIRMLAADVDSDALVEQVDDVNAIAAANGYTAGASNARLDLNVDGIIDTSDSGAAGELVGNTVTCGEGMMGGSMMAGEGTFGLGGAETLVDTPVSVAMVAHDTGASSVTLPATGGTISVDVVVNMAVPIWGFEGRPTVDAANVASIGATNWTELDNIMMSNGRPSAALTSYYDLTVLDWVWFATAPDGQEIMGSDIEPLLSENPPVFMTLVNDLTALDGPISTPAGEWFTTSATLSGSTRVPTGPGQFVAATLSITVSATPGTYHLTLSEARYVNIAYVAPPIAAVQPLEIVVQGQ